MHGQKRSKVSEYGRQLREKQKAKRVYGLQERQFRNYYLKADKRKGVTGENLLELLERRLDNVIYRLGFASTRKQARQLVLHRHFLVNGKRVNIPSFLVKQGDELSVKESYKESPVICSAVASKTASKSPDWLSVDVKKLTGKVDW
jgi:small subunit ribosomal protein S4